MAHLANPKPLPHIAIVPTPGMGHLFPLIEFAKRLVVRHDFAVTFIVPTDGSPIELQKKLLESLPNPISHLFLPPANLADLPEDGMIEARIELSLTRSLSSLRESLNDIMSEPSTRLVAIVVDVFGPSAFDVAIELGLLPYIFFPTSTTVLSFFFHLPKLDETTRCEYRDLADPIRLPGCVPVHGRDLFNPLHDRKTETYKAFVKMTKRYNMARGIMVNTFVDLEPGPIKAFEDGVHKNPPIYPIGPLTQSGSDSGPSQPECLIWLDKQPIGSVMFVSFGSGGTLSSEQIAELAFGLETSGQRFLWVLKSPNEKSSEAAFFTLKSDDNNPFDCLPTGFLERTKDVGFVVDSWAPQVQVLAHESTGGFLTHCGWNSTLESVVNGVPLIAWPLYAEQRMNAVLLSDGLKVATRVESNEKGIMGREEIAKKAKELMEGDRGKSMKNRMNELKEAARMALGDEGSSTKSLDEVAKIWKSHNI